MPDFLTSIVQEFGSLCLLVCACSLQCRLCSSTGTPPSPFQGLAYRRFPVLREEEMRQGIYVEEGQAQEAFHRREAAVEHAADPAGLAVEVEPQAEAVQPVQRGQRGLPYGLLDHGGEDHVAQLVGALRADPGDAVGRDVTAPQGRVNGPFSKFLAAALALPVRGGAAIHRPSFRCLPGAREGVRA